MIIVEKLEFVESVDNSGSSSSNARANKVMVPPKIYPKNIDMSRIPYFYVSNDDDLDDDDDDDDDDDGGGGDGDGDDDGCKKCGDGDDDDYEKYGFYEFPENDIELLDCCQRPAPRYRRNGKLKRSLIYCVQLEAEICTPEDCLELLKSINCESQFISCSVEVTGRFMAELHKNEAEKLKGVKDVRHVFPFHARLYDL